MSDIFQYFANPIANPTTFYISPPPPSLSPSPSSRELSLFATSTRQLFMYNKLLLPNKLSTPLAKTDNRQ